MQLYLRFTIVSGEGDLNHQSRDFLGVDIEDAGFEADATHDSLGHPIIEDEDGYWAVLPGLAGHALEAETLEDALVEIATRQFPYGNISQPYAIYEGDYVEDLAFGDGDVFKPSKLIYESK